MTSMTFTLPTLHHVHKSIEDFVPFYKKGKKPRIPRHIRNLYDIKLKVYRYQKTDPSYKSLYINLDKLYTRAVKNHNKFIEQKILACNNKKSFYGFINRKLHKRSHIPPLINSSSAVITEPKDKADLLNTQFSSVFQIDNNDTNPSLFIKNKLQQMVPMGPIRISPSSYQRLYLNLKVLYPALQTNFLLTFKNKYLFLCLTLFLTYLIKLSHLAKSPIFGKKRR